jgi:hypothetical protein
VKIGSPRRAAECLQPLENKTSDAVSGFGVEPASNRVFSEFQIVPLGTKWAVACPKRKLTELFLAQLSFIFPQHKRRK